jgi:hypothetical protein
MEIEHATAMIINFTFNSISMPPPSLELLPFSNSTQFLSSLSESKKYKKKVILNNYSPKFACAKLKNIINFPNRFCFGISA